MTESQADCRFCFQPDSMRDEIIAQDEDFFLLPAKGNTGGRYLIIPRVHAETLLELPGNFWEIFKRGFTRIPDLPSDFNLSVNKGKQAGQTIKHIHFWIVRRADEEGLLSEGLGLASILDLIREKQIPTAKIK